MSGCNLLWENARNRGMDGLRRQQYTRYRRQRNDMHGYIGETEP